MTYPVLCAWCLKEGLRVIIGFSGVQGSHGICSTHKMAALAEIRRMR